MSAKKSRSNKKQISVLVDFMSTHNLATGEFTGPLRAKRAESQWLVLKEILKEHGPDRSVDQWKQTWKDIKKGARAENAAASRGLNATGNAQSVPSVSETSTKVLNIIGHDCTTGIGPEESTIGVADEIIEIADGNFKLKWLKPPSPTFFADKVENIPPTPTSKRKEKVKERADECFQQLQAENNSILQSINNSLIERNNLLREQNVLLREQNVLLREQNAHLARANKLKRLKRFTRR